MPRLSKKNNNHCFHLGSAHACFLRTRRTFRVPFRTLPFGLGIIVEHPWFIACYYFIQKIWINFESFLQILKKFPTGSLSAPQTSFSALVLHKFFACANDLLKFYELHIYPSPFLLQSSWHSIGGLSPSQLAPLPHFHRLLTRLVFQNEGRLRHFLGPLRKALCLLTLKSPN